MKSSIAVIQPLDGKIAGALVRPGRLGHLEPVACEVVSSDAFRKAHVVRMQKAVSGISELIESLRSKHNSRISGLWCGVSASSTRVFHARGSVLLSRYGRTIMPRDITRCIDVASTVRIPLDRRVIHRIVSSFTLDGADEVLEPQGMEAMKLESSVSIVTVKASTAENLRKCVEESGQTLEGFVYTPLSEYFVFIPHRHRRGNIAFLDIARDLSQLVSFKDGILSDACGIGMGKRALCGPHDDPLPDKTDIFLKEVASRAGVFKADELVLAGELCLSEELMDGLEKCLGIPVTATSAAGCAGPGMLNANMPLRYLKGMLEYLAKNEYRRIPLQERTRPLHARLTRFLERYF